MDEMMEIIDFQKEAPMKCFLNRLGHSGRHWHDCLEILFVLMGNSTVILADKVFTMNEGDILVINRNEMHEISSDDCTQIALQINDNFYREMLPEGTSFYFQCNSVFQENNAAFDELRHLIASLIKNNNDKAPGYQIQNSSLTYHLIYILLSNFLTSKKEYGTTKNAERISELITIINTEYYTDLSLNALSARMHLSTPYLSKYFKLNTGTTFLSYLTDVRLAHAVNDLLSSNDAIEEIALRNGFSSNLAFLQAFKKNYDCLPSAYRRSSKQHQQNKDVKKENASLFSYMDLSHHNYLASLKKYLTVPEKEHSNPSVLPKSLQVNAETSHTTSLLHTWKCFTSVGKAKELLYADIQAELTSLQKMVGFRYIKFHGIFSDDMFVYSEDKEGNPVFCFSYIDKVLDFLLSTGLKPLIQLSFMPAALAKDPDRTTFGFITSPPKKLASWTRLVKEFTLHLLDTYGREEVISWPFCVWNEPDTPNMFAFEDTEFFYRFYQVTWQTVKELAPEIAFGTPSSYFIPQDGFRNFFEDFLPWCDENHCKPDFINTHFYGTEFTPNAVAPLGMQGTLTLSSNENLFQRFVKDIRAMAKEQNLSNVPIYLTEWNSSPSHCDFLADTCFKSCYLIKNILENYDKLNSFGYWTLSDFLEEMTLPKEIFHGGLGIYTQNGIRKPAYYAFSFLSKLGDELIKKGEHYFITRSLDGYQILLYNYKHFSELYATGELFDMTPLNRYTPFSPEENLTCNITLDGLPNKTYNIIKTSISRTSGSAFDQWIKMGAPEKMSREAVTVLNETAQPIPVYTTEDVIQNELTISSTLETLEVQLITVQAQL